MTAETQTDNHKAKILDGGVVANKIKSDVAIAVERLKNYFWIKVFFLPSHFTELRA